MSSAARKAFVLAAALACVAGLAGCVSAASTSGSATSPPATAPASVAPSAPASPPPTASVDVPITGTGLEQQVPVAVPPVRIRIPALGVDMSVQPEGVAEGGAMALPPNPADAGWYRFGSWPGSAEGATVIAAHVDSLDYGLGPLARLPEATAGTEILVTRADGQEHRYTVQDGGMTRKQDVAWDTVFDRSGPARLTVVTCGGEFDYERRTYLDNVVVNAVPVP
jgi:hypothetical protein